MSRLEKCVCMTYICLAIVLGGLAGYYKFVASNEAKKFSNNSEKMLSPAPTIEKTSIPIKVELTAYCNCAICSEAWGSETAMQTHTRIGIVAAPKDIPFGSKIFIPELKNYKEDGIFEVEDRGGAVIVKSNGAHIIDVWLPDHEQVKEFGRKETTVYIMK